MKTKYKILPNRQLPASTLKATLLREDIELLKKEIDKDVKLRSDQAEYTLGLPMDQLSKEAVRKANKEKLHIDRLVALVGQYEALIDLLTAEHEQSIQKLTLYRETIENQQRSKLAIIQLCLNQTKENPKVYLTPRIPQMPPTRSEEIYY